MNKIEETMEIVHNAKKILIKRNKRDKSEKLDLIMAELDLVLDKLDEYNQSKKTKAI